MIGTAIALNLLFGIPLVAGAIITAVDVFLILYLMRHGFRVLEAFVIALLLVIFACFGIQMLLAAPPIHEVLGGFIPRARGRHQSGGAVHRDRHHRRHRDAAQPVPAFVDRADPRLSARRRRQAHGDPLGGDRQHHRA